MSGEALFGSVYALLLASAAAVLFRRSRPDACAREWPRVEIARFHFVIAWTLVAVACAVLLAIAARHPAEPLALACVGSSGAVVGAITRLAASGRRVSQGASKN